jgi:hypothetical protein
MNSFHSALSTFPCDGDRGSKTGSHAILRVPPLIPIFGDGRRTKDPVTSRASPSSLSSIIHYEKLSRYQFNKNGQYLFLEYSPQLKEKAASFADG